MKRFLALRRVVALGSTALKEVPAEILESSHLSKNEVCTEPNGRAKLLVTHRFFGSVGASTSQFALAVFSRAINSINQSLCQSTPTGTFPLPARSDDYAAIEAA